MRTAQVAVRAGRVWIKRPGTDRENTDPERLEVTLVVATEVDAPEVDASAKVTPLCWRLLTTLPALDLAQAMEAVRCYRLRWRIEQVFRALKSDGLGLDRAQLTCAGRLLKLAAFALCAAVRTLQLVDARDGGGRPATDVADEDLIAAAAAIGPRLEGKTPRQKNPHPPGSLPWLAWIAARLGGWNCYYKPPGPKTMRNGWDKLAAATFGYIIAKAHNV
jgi:Transposase DDE domain